MAERERDIITVRGRFDGTSTGAFLRIVQAVLGRGAHNVVVDLGEADVAASGLRALAIAQARVQGGGRRVVLKAPNSSTLRLLRDARLIDRFVIG
jgi:anti-anti-sigma regulatory factor